MRIMFEMNKSILFFVFCCISFSAGAGVTGTTTPPGYEKQEDTSAVESNKETANADSDAAKKSTQ